MNKKELFLTSLEYGPLNQVRKIESYEWKIIQQQNCLVVEFDLPIEHPSKGIASSIAYLTNRFVEQDERFTNFNTFPLYVHASIPDIPAVREIESFDDLLHLAWAEVYDNYSDANLHR